MATSNVNSAALQREAAELSCHSLDTDWLWWDWSDSKGSDQSQLCYTLSKHFYTMFKYLIQGVGFILSLTQTPYIASYQTFTSTVLSP